MCPLDWTDSCFEEAKKNSRFFFPKKLFSLLLANSLPRLWRETFLSSKEYLISLIFCKLNPPFQEKFSRYFWAVFNRVCRGVPQAERPPYFQVRKNKAFAKKLLNKHYLQFLTVLAFYVFREERVDVSVVEVGIGGAYDTTNVIRKPKV